MFLLPFYFLFSTRPEDRKIINTLSLAFEENQRMKAIIGKHRRDFMSRLKVVITFSYLLVKKSKGIFSTRDQSTYLLYYQKSEYRLSLADRFRRIWLGLFVVGLPRVLKVLKREKRVLYLREKQTKLKGDTDYLYVWFLAKKPEIAGIRSLIEAKNYIVKKSIKTGLPIYMETTDERLLMMYRRAGFEFYACKKLDDSDLKMWFGRREV